jgi:uncharacterized protein YndB with AHSA1/START domain
MAISEVVEIGVGRPPGQVFHHLTAVERWPEWLIASGVVRVERLGDPAMPLQAGERLRIEQRVAGRSATLDARVTKLESPTSFVIEGRDADGVTVDIEAVAVAAGAGTRLRWSIRIGLPLRFRLFERMAAPQVQRAVALDLEAFRRRLESVAAD